MTPRQRIIYALMCTFCLVLAAARCVIVALGKEQPSVLSMTFTLISGLAGLVGVIAALYHLASRTD